MPTFSNLNTALGKVGTVIYSNGADTVHGAGQYAIDAEGIAKTGNLFKVKWSPSAIHTAAIVATVSGVEGGIPIARIIHQPVQISGLTRGTNTSGLLRGVRVLDKGDQGLDIEIILLNAATSFPAQGAVLSLSDADADFLFNRVKIFTQDYEDQTLNMLANRNSLAMPLWPVSATDGCLVAIAYRGATSKTFGASDLEITFEVEK